MKDLIFMGVAIGLLVVMITQQPVVIEVIASIENNTSDPGRGIIVPNDTGHIVRTF